VHVLLCSVVEKRCTIPTVVHLTVANKGVVGQCSVRCIPGTL
jgi:hypothetical protein